MRKPDAGKGKPESDFRVQCISSVGVYALHLFHPMLVYLGGMGHLNGVAFLGQTITGGTIVTFYMYISKFFTPIQNLAEQFNWLQSALASAEKVFSIMDLEPKLVDAPDAIELEEVHGEIEFRNVWFPIFPGNGCCRVCLSM